MATSPAARTKAMQAVQAIFDRYFLILAHPSTTRPLYDSHIMEHAKLIDAGPDGSARFELEMTQNYANINGVMHGGAAGVIFDMCTTSALGPVAKPGFWDFLGGVTRSLNISYLRAVPMGVKVHITSEVKQVGRTMAMIRGAMTSPDGKVTYCTCEHHKVAVPTRPEHLLKDFELEWDRTAREDELEAKRKASREKL